MRSAIIALLLGSCSPLAVRCDPPDAVPVPSYETVPPSIWESAPIPEPAPPGVIPEGWYDPETGEPVIPTTVYTEPSPGPCEGICGPATVVMP